MLFDFTELFSTDRERIRTLKREVSAQRRTQVDLGLKHTGRIADLRDQVATLSRIIVVLLAALEAKDVVSRTELRSLLRDLAIYDENGDGTIDLDDLVARLPEAQSAPIRRTRRRTGKVKP